MAVNFNPDNVLLSTARTGAVPTAIGELIVQNVMQESAIMKLGKYIEMKDKDGQPVLEKKFTYLAKGLGAYWVGEAEKIQTSKAEYLDATMKAKKLGVIVPVSREFLHYSVKDFFNEVKPLIQEAFQKKFDEAGILNVNNPFGFSIEQAVVTADNVVEGEISHANIMALQDELYEDGFEPNAYISKTQNNTALRGANANVNGVVEQLYDRSAKTLDGAPVVNIQSESLPKGTIYAGDFDYLYYGIPYTLTYAISEDATLTTLVDGEEKVISLFEREMIALRATMDVGLMVVKEDAFAKLEPTPAP